MNLIIHIQPGRDWKRISAPILNGREKLSDLSSKETAAQQ